MIQHIFPNWTAMTVIAYPLLILITLNICHSTSENTESLAHPRAYSGALGFHLGIDFYQSIQLHPVRT
jgi:hypothetical protein